MNNTATLLLFRSVNVWTGQTSFHLSTFVCPPSGHLKAKSAEQTLMQLCWEKRAFLILLQEIFLL